MSPGVPIPQTDPRANYLAHRAELDAAIARALEGGRYILGPEVEAFEQAFARYLGVPHAIGVGSGTEALWLAVAACGVKAGDEVITVSHTAVATVAAIERCGAIPVFVDIDLATYTMDPACVEAAASAATRAIVPVHLYGQAAALEPILAIAKRHGWSVVEDCAQSHGAAYRGTKTGAWGDIAAFSFYPTKNLGAIGDGGAVATSRADLAERVRLLREYGWRDRYVSEIPGWNSRLDPIQAAILGVKLAHLDRDNARRVAIAAAYHEALADLDLALPARAAHSDHVYHQFVVRHAERDALKEALAAQGIGTLIHYPMPVHLQPAYRGRSRVSGSLARSEQAAAGVLSLPIYPELEIDRVHTVAAAVRSWSRTVPA